MSRPYRRSSRARKPSDPMLLGEPSPALTKIARMNTEKLKAHIETMKVEAERLDKKITNLSAIDETDPQRIDELKKHRQRLAALMQAAAERLLGKLERKKERIESGAPMGPPGSTAGGAGRPVSRGYRRRQF